MHFYYLIPCLNGLAYCRSRKLRDRYVDRLGYIAIKRREIPPAKLRRLLAAKPKTTRLGRQFGPAIAWHTEADG